MGISIADSVPKTVHVRISADQLTSKAIDISLLFVTGSYKAHKSSKSNSQYLYSYHEYFNNAQRNVTYYDGL